MAEYSGFYEAMPTGDTHQDGSPKYDREYYASAFAIYFSLFVGNGVFASPAGQLMVVATGNGLKIRLKAGWAFILGYWYHNDSDIEYDILYNTTAAVRKDSIKLRLDLYTRETAAHYCVDDVSVQRTDYIYELKLAEIAVNRSALMITDSVISDTRPDNSVCGFVKGLVEVADTEELFRQYNAAFNEWFDTVKGQLTADMAVQLAERIGILANLTTVDKTSLVVAINEINAKFSEYLPLTGGRLYGKKDVLYLDNTLENATGVEIRFAVKGVNCHTFSSTNTGRFTIWDFINSQNVLDANTTDFYFRNKKILLESKDFVLSNQVTLTFTNNIATISDSRITANSLADVYFTSDTIATAEKAEIYVDTYDGKVQLTAKNTPTGNIRCSIRVRVP